MRILLRTLTTAVGVAAAAWLFTGIGFDGPSRGWEEVQEKIVPLLVVSLILSIVTSFVKPILTIVSIPLIVLTLGFFLLVINALMLKLAAALSDPFGTGFFVEGFWTAVGGAIVITVVTWIVDAAFGTDT
ncbi:phage holin family protein [Nocardioides sp. R-C-SC26]|uniref:phage holin family protein n=1 Tax=Nocardioides sp. R-C-SC26 TaxID=2870414 RepID=UPI001E48AB0D|nr:phage holin family protein [Nocardioides sp. R-C-SC26]